MKWYLSPRITWKRYKKLHDETAAKDSGPTPKNINKMIWLMLKERKLNVYITDENANDTWCLTLKEIPKKAKIFV